MWNGREGNKGAMWNKHRRVVRERETNRTVTNERKMQEKWGTNGRKKMKREEKRNGEEEKKGQTEGK